jgi:hypothetical protein
MPAWSNPTFLSDLLAAHLADDPWPAPSPPLPQEPPGPDPREPGVRRGYHILSMAGALRNGAQRGGGMVWHAVPVGDESHIEDAGTALCGRAPSIMWSGWQPAGLKVTCPRCLKKLEARK